MNYFFFYTSYYAVQQLSFVRVVDEEHSYYTAYFWYQPPTAIPAATVAAGVHGGNKNCHEDAIWRIRKRIERKDTFV